MREDLVTFRVLFFNHERYVDRCVESVLAQTHTPLQIVFSDDCSNDSTFERLRRAVDQYTGPHEILLNQTPRNLGVSAHLNSVRRLTQGKLEIAGAGDDYFHPERAAKVFAKWQSLGRASCSIFSQVVNVSDKGEVLSIDGDEPFRTMSSFQRIADRNPILFGSYPGCSQSYTMDQWEIFGELDDRIIANDVSRQLRSALIGGVAFIPEPLVYYRQTPASLSRFAKNSFAAYTQKRLEYISNFRLMIEQFQKDAVRACEMKFVSVEDRDWAIDAADRYWHARQQEIKGFTGSLATRLRIAVGPHRSSRSFLRSVVSACFPRLVHRFRSCR